jgi:glycosyltransferase involved in cell wall biosynthesis
MKIMFHTGALNYRGTTVAITDYARYNQEILGNESVICYNLSIPYMKDMGTEHAVVEALSKQFEVLGHDGSAAGVESLVDKHKIDTSYFIRSGERDFLPNNCRTLVHAVFQQYEPHGDCYAYVSQWLANKMNSQHGTSIPSVPHIVQLPEPTDNLREKMGIPAHHTIIGRHGGYDTFDLPWVHQAVATFLEQHDDYTFVFVGTRPWINHPRVLFYQEIHDVQDKANFIDTCDAMLHGRGGGESFGLSIAEFLSLGKPVMAWNGGGDQNHIDMLADSELLYNNPIDLNHMLSNFKDNQQDWASRVSGYRPQPAMEQFKKVFL